MTAVKILFAVLIIVCAAFYVLYIGSFSLILLIIMCSVPVIMLVSLFITKKLLSAELTVSRTLISKNEPLDIQLQITNRCILPVGKAEAVIEYYNAFNTRSNALELHFPIQARNSQRLTFQLSSKFCGVLKIRSAYIVIYDPLRIFKFKIAKNICQDIVILPQGSDIGGVVSYSDRFNDESLVFSEHRAGDDSSEVFDLREYNPGDKLNRIHWKLSSKKDEFIVKEYSLPVDSPAAVFVNLRCREDSEYTLPVFDTLMETFVSVSQLMLENERAHTVIYYNCRKECFVSLTVDSYDSLNAAVTEMLLSAGTGYYPEAPEKFFSEPQNDSWASFTFITAEADEAPLNILDDETDADIKNTLLIVKEAESAENYDNIFLSMRIIPVAAGRVAASVRDIEL